MQNTEKKNKPYGIHLRRLLGASVIVMLFFAAGLHAQTTGKTVVRQKAKTPPAAGAEEVGEARRRLAELGYWINATGAADEASLRHALIAFQKIENRPRTGLLTTEELQALRKAQRPATRETGYAHVEIDLCRQVLFLVESGNAPPRILPVSTGSGECFTEGGRTRRAVTPTGRFAIKRKINGWHKSPLGLLYYPSYIHGGVAIHGNPSVPPQPASHGCIRIPMFAAEEFSKSAVIGMPVIVYNGNEPIAQNDVTSP